VGKNDFSIDPWINGIEGSWSFAKERLLQHHGGETEKFTSASKKGSSGRTIMNGSLFIIASGSPPDKMSRRIGDNNRSENYQFPKTLNPLLNF